jgi:hypothetical protein
LYPGFIDACGNVFVAALPLGFELLGSGRVALDNVLFIGVVDIGVGLFFGGEPAVADEEAADVPLVLDLRELVALEDSCRNVRDVLPCVRFTSNVYLWRLA